MIPLLCHYHIIIIKLILMMILLLLLLLLIKLINLFFADGIGTPDPNPRS